MKVFVTGASGFVGSAIVRELIGAGHQVLGLARSNNAAAALTAAGAEVHRGTLNDLDSLRSGAAAADAVIHTAYNHDFSDRAGAAALDQGAIDAIGEVLAASDRPLIVTAGTAGLPAGRLSTEADPARAGDRPSEPAALALAARGVHASVMRLPPSVHGEGDHGFVPFLISIAREKGISAYPGDGTNRWASVHRFDAARLYRLALESAPAGTILHAIADEGVSTRAIAEVIGRHLNIPVVSLPADEASKHFGWIGVFFGLDIPASSALTQQRFNWHPTELSLLADLDHDYYFK